MVGCFTGSTVGYIISVKNIKQEIKRERGGEKRKKILYLPEPPEGAIGTIQLAGDSGSG